MDSEIDKFISKKLPVTHSYLLNKYNVAVTECQKTMKEHLSKYQNSALFLKLVQGGDSLIFTISTKESENCSVYSILPSADYDFIENNVLTNNVTRKSFPIINCEKTVKEQSSIDNSVSPQEMIDVPSERLNSGTNKIINKPQEIMKVIEPLEKIKKEKVKPQEKIVSKAVKSKDKVVKDVIKPQKIKKEVVIPKFVTKIEDKVDKSSKMDAPKTCANLFDNFEEGDLKISRSMKEAQNNRKRKRILDSDNEEEENEEDVGGGNEVLVEDSFSEDMRGSYKVMKKEDKTYVDEEGFLVTERVSVVHTITPEADMNNNTKKNSVASLSKPNTLKTKSTKSAGAKKQKLDATNKSKQTNLLSFFTKKS